MLTQTAPPAALPPLTAPVAPAAARTTDDYRRLGGWLLLLGSIAMVVGAALLQSTGTDLDAALVDGEVGAWLTAAEEHRSALVANLILWTAGVPTLALGGILLTRTAPDGPLAVVARFGFTVGAAGATIFYPLWMGLVLGLGGRPELEAVATALGQGVTIADWVATIMVLSVGGASLAFLARDRWVPAWVRRFAYAAAAMGPIAALTLILGVREVTFILVPVGMVLVIALSIAALRAAPEPAAR